MGITSRDLAGRLAVVIEVFALLLNSITMLLIKRQGLDTVDMWLASIMASCDNLLVILKLGQWLYIEVTSDTQFLQSKSFGQFDGFLTGFFTGSSVCCVGWLALIRWWAIVRKRRIDHRFWGMSFALTQLILITGLGLVAKDFQFVIMPFGRYFYPDITSHSVITLLTTTLLVLACFFSLIAINLCYPMLTWVYYQQLTTPPSLFTCLPHEIKPSQLRNKCFLLLKMTSLLFIYNLIMLPPLAVITTELITLRTRSLLGDSLFGIGFIILTLVNPLTLILLHQDTYTDFKRLLSNLYHHRSIHHPHPSQPNLLEDARTGS